MPTGTPATAARQYHEQQVHYMRIGVNFNDAGIANGVGKDFLPAGALLIGTDVHIATAFNAATTNVLTVGTNAAAYDNIIAAADVAEGATGLTQNVKPTGTALGSLAADAQVFVKFTQTGAAATTGAAIIVIKYVVNNDR